jgi:hypothetical protein
MTSAANFAKGLVGFFADPEVRKRLADHQRPSYEIGDGTEVVLDDYITIPEAFGGRRAGQWAVVIKLSDEGLGLRFDEKIGGITREFFEWSDLMGAKASAAPRDRKRTSVMPPSTNKPSM